MRSDKADIYYAPNENDHCYDAIFVSTDVENISAILYIVCRWKVML